MIATCSRPPARTSPRRQAARGIEVRVAKQRVCVKVTEPLGSLRLCTTEPASAPEAGPRRRYGIRNTRPESSSYAPGRILITTLTYIARGTTTMSPGDSSGVVLRVAGKERPPSPIALTCLVGLTRSVAVTVSRTPWQWRSCHHIASELRSLMEPCATGLPLPITST